MPDLAALTSPSPELRREILDLCYLAYAEDLTGFFEASPEATHVICREGSAVVAHAMWVTRWLQVDYGRPLRTAYVEAVATHPAFRGRGLASRVMRRLVSELPVSFELAALCPATVSLYERLGWRFWLGPLSIRMPSGERLDTPDERVMIYELAGRPQVDRYGVLSAEWRPGEVW
jgi:GNAT superfamily N-acetyltransferase